MSEVNGDIAGEDEMRKRAFDMEGVADEADSDDFEEVVGLHENRKYTKDSHNISLVDDSLSSKSHDAEEERKDQNIFESHHGGGGVIYEDEEIGGNLDHSDLQGDDEDYWSRTEDCTNMSVASSKKETAQEQSQSHLRTAVNHRYSTPPSAGKPPVHPHSTRRPPSKSSIPSSRSTVYSDGTEMTCDIEERARKQDNNGQSRAVSAADLVEQVYQNLKKVVRPKSHRYFFKRHKESFTGRKVIHQLIELGYVNTKESALYLSSELVNYGYIIPIVETHGDTNCATSTQDFSASRRALYRFCSENAEARPAQKSTRQPPKGHVVISPIEHSGKSTDKAATTLSKLKTTDVPNLPSNALRAPPNFKTPNYLQPTGMTQRPLKVCSKEQTMNIESECRKNSSQLDRVQRKLFATRTAAICKHIMNEEIPPSYQDRPTLCSSSEMSHVSKVACAMTSAPPSESKLESQNQKHRENDDIDSGFRLSLTEIQNENARLAQTIVELRQELASFKSQNSPKSEEEVATRPGWICFASWLCILFSAVALATLGSIHFPIISSMSEQFELKLTNGSMQYLLVALLLVCTILTLFICSFRCGLVGRRQKISVESNAVTKQSPPNTTHVEKEVSPCTTDSTLSRNEYKASATKDAVPVSNQPAGYAKRQVQSKSETTTTGALCTISTQAVVEETHTSMPKNEVLSTAKENKGVDNKQRKRREIKLPKAAKEKLKSLSAEERRDWLKKWKEIQHRKKEVKAIPQKAFWEKVWDSWTYLFRYVKNKLSDSFGGYSVQTVYGKGNERTFSDSNQQIDTFRQGIQDTLSLASANGDKPPASNTESPTQTSTVGESIEKMLSPNSHDILNSKNIMGRRTGSLDAASQGNGRPMSVSSGKSSIQGRPVGSTGEPIVPTISDSPVGEDNEVDDGYLFMDDSFRNLLENLNDH